VFVGAFRAYPVVTVVCTTGIVITAFYVLRLVQRLFFGVPRLAHEAVFGDANRVEFAALTLLMVFILAVGLYPLPFLRLIGSAVAPIAANLGGM
jgi:NADH-quinone oxidoreductase subunit M